MSNNKRVFEAAWEVITRRTFDRAMAATELAIRNLQAEGEVRRDGDELWVGQRALGKDRELLPRLARATGLGFAAYAGNRRVAAATVLDAGCAPPVGEFAAAPLSDTVLRRGEVYRGHIDYAGRRYISVGRPIFSRDGAEYSPIGMLEAYQDEEAFFDLVSASSRTSLESQNGSSERKAESLEAVVAFIDTVARKLQQLALNGNIIAAQAGKQGAAFRVVCNELGTLAEQAKTTTGHIRRVLRPNGVANENGDLDSGSDSTGWFEMTSPESTDAQSSDSEQATTGALEPLDPAV